MKKRSKYVIIVFLVFSLPFHAYDQSVKQPKTGNAKQQKKRLAKLEKQEIKDQEKAEKELIKSHYKKQNKSTRKMMKRTKKKSKRIKNGKSAEPFWIKWFRK